MKRRTTQLLDRVAASRPVPPHATRQVAGEATRRALLERILDDDPGPGAPAGCRVRRRPTRRAFRLAVVGLTFAVAAALAIGLLPGRGPGGAPAAEALELAARTAAAQPSRWPGPGECWYMRGTTVYDRGRPGESREIGETWIAPDGRLWDRSSPDGKGPIRLVLLPESEFGGSGLTIQELRGLPAEPKALAARLEQLKGRISPDGPDAPLRIETVAFDLLAHPALGPAQRASVFRLLAADPRMQVTEGVTDWAGRRATRISYDDRYGHVEVLMDPATTELTSGLSRFSGQEDLEGQAEKGRYSIESRSDQVRIVPVPDGLLG